MNPRGNDASDHHRPAVAASATPRRRSAPIALALALGFGALVVAPAAALYFAITSSRDNALAQVRDRYERAVATIGERTHLHLQPAWNQGEYLAGLIARGDVDVGDRARLGDALVAALAATPQVQTLAFLGPDLQGIRVEQRPQGPVTLFVDLSASAGLRAIMERTAVSERPYWGNPVWLTDAGVPVINIHTPVRRDGRFLGSIIALVTIRELSRFLTASEFGAGANTFILFDREWVLAHPSLIDGTFRLSADHPLPRLDEIGDPVLAAIWAPQQEALQDRRLLGNADVGHIVEVGGSKWVIMHRDLHGFGDRSWLVGRYFPLSEVTREVEQIREAALFGLAVLALALAVALLLGRAIGRPIRLLSEAAARLRQLDFEAMPALGRSRMRELDEAIRAFLALRGALRWLEMYLPRRLVKRLIAAGEGGELPSDQRAVTLLFSDIVGFTGLAESMTARETADFLNEHLTLVAQAVESEDGNIDKYMGDCVMAIWGAPDRPEDHADRACRAALAIVAAIEADNARRRAAGLFPVRVRIGVHTGVVTVGNIGAPGRINYTVVGDAVNTAQRLESLGRDYLGDEDEAVVLVSGDTVAALHAPLPMTAVGQHPVRGRREGITVFRLV